MPALGKSLARLCPLLVLAVLASACQPSSPTGSATPSPPTGSLSTSAATPIAKPVAAKAGTALAALAHLRVQGRASMTNYDRGQFGQAWADVDRNGCDTRNDILRRDLSRKTLKADTHGCLVLSGTLHDPYTGRNLHFTRGVATSDAVQIDHVVALGDAWQMGAQGWDAAKRQTFANDPLELLAVDGPENEAKGDADAASWLPPQKAYRCSYVARQVAVKTKYGLSVTAAEKLAIARVLVTCPTRRMPTSAPIPLGGSPVAFAAGAPSPSPRPPTTSAPAGATAICRDGTFSYSLHHSGTCSYHGGVLKWL